MRVRSRMIQRTVREAARMFPAIVITGPRRAGKTTLLRSLFPGASYVLLEDPDVVARARSDPRALLDGIPTPAVFDEIQNAPELFPYVRTRIDGAPREMGRWLFTGWNEGPLMRGVTESMPGRAAVLRLPPLSLAESSQVSLLLGGYPEAVARPRSRDLWFASYIQTYLERDVRSILGVRDLALFRRFLSLVANRHGQVLNKTDLAAPLGLSIPAISSWLDVLDVTGQIALVPPYFENFGKRIIKSPKIYINDSGMACHLLGIRTQAELERSPFLGALFEGFIASEIIKSQINRGRRRELYYFRDQQGLEVDFLFPGAGGGLWLVECKASKTATPSMAVPLASLMRSIGERAAVRATVVHRPSRSATKTRALAPGIEAVDYPQFVADLSKRDSGRIRLVP